MRKYFLALLSMLFVVVIFTNCDKDDVTNEEVLLQLKVVNGKVVVPGGIHYRVLVLPDHKVLSMAVLAKRSEQYSPVR